MVNKMQGSLVKTALSAATTFFAMILFALASSLVSAAQASTPCGIALAPQAQDLLTAKFPEWRPKQVSDLGIEDQQLWLKAHGKECPGIAIGHLETLDTLSYAVLLVPKSRLNKGYKIVVFSKALGNTYHCELLDHNEQGDSGLVISKAKPGKYSDFESTESIRTKLDSLYVEWIEKGALLYYWSAGRYRTLQVSD
jgi:hypothetical protein